MAGESRLLLFSENELQVFALLFMGVVYALKIRWIFRFPAGRDRQASTGSPRTSGPQGARYSLLQIARPWAMPSTRQHPVLYAEFVVFHLGVAVSITMSFLIPYAPGLIASRSSIFALRAIFALAVVAGGLRLIRRIKDPYMRAFSTLDDYFSVSLLTVWLAFSLLAASNQPRQGEWPLLAYFFLTAFFLMYVPFSKISHYLFYPFTRWYLGRTLGHRGVYPPRKPREKFAVGS